MSKFILAIVGAALVSLSVHGVSAQNPPPPPPPDITAFPAHARVTEGEDVTFRLVASPSPAADLKISVTVSQEGDFGASPTGQRTVTIAADETQATLTVTTVDDEAYDPQGSVTLTVNPGSGYEIEPGSVVSTTVVEDNEPHAICSLPSDPTSFGPANLVCLDVEVRYDEDETDDAEAYELFYAGTMTPVPDLVRRSGDLYAQRVIYNTAVGPDGRDPNLVRYNYAREVCADEGFDCFYTFMRSTASSELYNIATDLVIRCAEGFRCSLSIPSQRHSSTSTVRAPADPSDPPLRPRNERVVPEAEGRQLYRIRYNNDGNARDAARYAAVFEAVCPGEYAAGATCEFFDHYYNDHVDAGPGPDGVTGTEDDVEEVQGTPIGTTLVVTCDPDYTCDLDLTFVAEVPAKAGTDGVLGTEDDVAAVPAHYTATYTPTYVEPRESAPQRPVTGRATRATAGSVSISARTDFIRNEDGTIATITTTNTVTGVQTVTRQTQVVHVVNGQLNRVNTGTADDPATNADDTYLEYQAVKALVNQGVRRVPTITRPHIPEPEVPACLQEWRAAHNRGEAGSNDYVDYCTEAELDADMRAQEQYAADVEATHGRTGINQYDENGEKVPGSVYTSEPDDREGEQTYQPSTYDQQVERLEVRGEPYYDCIPVEVWNELAHGPRCALVYHPVGPATN